MRHLQADRRGRIVAITKEDINGVQVRFAMLQMSCGQTYPRKLYGLGR